MKFYLREKHSKLDLSSIFVKSVRNLTEVKETEKFMDASIREFGERSFEVE